MVLLVSAHARHNLKYHYRVVTKVSSVGIVNEALNSMSRELSA